jgi:hypothetical protein
MFPAHLEERPPPPTDLPISKLADQHSEYIDVTIREMAAVGHVSQTDTQYIVISP